MTEATPLVFVAIVVSRALVTLIYAPRKKLKSLAI